MHELSLAGGVLYLVEQAAQHEGFLRLQRLTLKARALQGVEVQSLRFALEAFMPGTCLAGSVNLGEASKVVVLSVTECEASACAAMDASLRTLHAAAGTPVRAVGHDLHSDLISKLAALALAATLTRACSASAAGCWMPRYWRCVVASSNRSPASWPWSSLTALTPSRSTTHSASDLRVSLAVAKWVFIVWPNSRGSSEYAGSGGLH